MCSFPGKGDSEERSLSDKYNSDVDLFDSYKDELKRYRDEVHSSPFIRLFNRSNNLANDFFNRSSNLYDEFKSIFLDLDDDRYGDDEAFLKDVKNVDRFLGSLTGGLISNPFNINYKPLNDKSTGYWAYPSPSSDIYDACKEKNGLSVWDEQGYWRCLFPKAIIPADKLGKVLSKEDVLEDSSNKNGLFFQDFNKYLDWKSNMKKILREERLKKLEQLRTKSSSDLINFDDLKKTQFDSLNASQINKDKKVTGQKDYYQSYESDGVKTESRKIYEYYDDGTSAVKEITKTFNKDADSKPIVEEHIEQFPAKKSGWFWDNSDDK